MITRVLARVRAHLRGDRAALVALVALAALVISALAAPLVEAALGVHHDVPDLGARYCAASLAHPLGCDPLGQDVLTRLLFGARVSLVVGLVAAFLQLAIGSLVGTIAAWRGGLVDAVAMRVVDALLALPLLPLLLVVAALRVGAPTAQDAGIVKLVVVLALFGWMPIARLMRVEVQRTMKLEMFHGARATGATASQILFRHVLPNSAAPVIVAGTLDVGRNILLEAALSYLGLGVRPPAPSWGNMLAHAESELWSRPLLAVWPGLCILLVVACVTVLGEALRRALDPRTRR
jgi:peptide/nickel transport system permease protein